MRGCYYRLNTELLKKAIMTKNEDSYLFLAELDFSKLNSQEIIGLELLQSHKPLKLVQSFGDNLQNLNNVNLPQAYSNLQLYVADVGQANWNELRSNDNTIVQYDMGADLHASRQQVDNIYLTHRQQIDKNNMAILVISHWDMDHIHCLLAMSDTDIRNTFSIVICPNALKSNTARQILQRLTNVLGTANVYCCSPYHHTPRTKYQMYHLCTLNNNIEIYIGANNRNINHSGIVMMVKGVSASVNYTGDCLLCQAKEVLNDVVLKGLQLNSHILIAPHHGGANEKKYMQYIAPPSIQQMSVCISVGSGNSYGHPDANMLNYLNLISGGSIMRTDVHVNIKFKI